jgi:NAD(P)-dependent dehydrogenase (short-subunit alcohol dehydrogenase family)
MAARGGGGIVDITAMPDEFGMAGAAASGPSKAAVAELTRTGAAELAANNSRVNAVAPGPTTTEGRTSTMGTDGIAQIGATVRRHRTATVEEIPRVGLITRQQRHRPPPPERVPEPQASIMALRSRTFNQLA